MSQSKFQKRLEEELGKRQILACVPKYNSLPPVSCDTQMHLRHILTELKKQAYHGQVSILDLDQIAFEYGITLPKEPI